WPISALHSADSESCIASLVASCRNNPARLCQHHDMWRRLRTSNVSIPLRSMVSLGSVIIACNRPTQRLSPPQGTNTTVEMEWGFWARLNASFMDIQKDLDDFVGVGDSLLGVAPPIISTAFWPAAGFPIRCAGFKDFGASWLDLSLNVFPSFDHSVSAPLLLG